MKKNFSRIILSVFLFTFLSSTFAQDTDTKPGEDILNWYNTKKTGMSTDKAYKELSKKTPDTVIVAVIDAGIDINHEDLQGHIWVNKEEVPDNGKDDDGNGYIDDVHGWNYLGNTNGKNQAHARLNVTRIYARLRKKYGENGSATISEALKDYGHYLYAEDRIDHALNLYNAYFEVKKSNKLEKDENYSAALTENFKSAKENISELLNDYTELIDTTQTFDSEKVQEYLLYLKTKKQVEEGQAKAKQTIARVKNFANNVLPMVPKMLANMIGVDSLTMDAVENWEPEGDRAKQMKRLGKMVLTGELTKEFMLEQVKALEHRVEYHYNPDFNGREVVGDNYLDTTDIHYGNPDVAGPKPYHGTHVGGIISAIRGNGLGGDGVANCVKLMVLRAVPDGDEFDKDVALAIRYAVDNGAKVINASFGKDFSSRPRMVHNALKYADQHGVLFVQAAGNSGENIDVNKNYPTNYYNFQKEQLDNIITIGASTRHHEKKLAATFSNYGQRVDIFAPGSEIYNSIPNDKYKILQGTSMAAPMVTGVIALIKGYFPSLTMAEIKDIILQSGDDFCNTKQILPGTLEDMVRFSALCNTGKVVNVLAAVKMAEEKVKEKQEAAGK